MINISKLLFWLAAIILVPLLAAEIGALIHKWGII